MMKDNPDERLLNVGFQPLARWKLVDDKLTYKFLVDTSEATARVKERAALYAFTSDGQVLYVGKTALSLDQRFAGYRSPGKTQATNARCHREIRALLAHGKEVTILSLRGLSHLRWGEFELNVAAALEDSLIAELEPRWNGGKNHLQSESEVLEREALQLTSEDPGSANQAPPAIETLVPEVERVVIGRFEIELGKTYYEQGIINPGVSASERLGKHDEPMVVRLGCNDLEGVQTTINRQANSNGSARLYGSRAVARWFQKHFQLGGCVNAYILSPNEIVLALPVT